MITNEQILELAKTCGFDSFTPEDRVCWECWEEQLIEFAQRVADIEYDRGFDDGWEGRADAERMLKLSKSGLVGDPQ